MPVSRQHVHAGPGNPDRAGRQDARSHNRASDRRAHVRSCTTRHVGRASGRTDIMKNFSRPSFARCYQAIPEIWRGGWTQRGSLHQVTRTLTNAETLALPTATIELAPAATGILTMPIALVFRADTAAGAYTNVDAAFELELRTNATKITNIDVTASRALVLAAAIHTWFIASVLDTTLTEGLDT